MKKQILLLAALFIAAFSQAQEAKMMRFPTIHDNLVVFTYAGDLYSVDKSGGIARKLTSNIGYNVFSKFSPDGKNVAFTGQYDGNTEVCLIPAEGGVPKRLTYTATLGRDDVSDRMGPNNIVMAWRDNEHIVYRSRKQSFNDFTGQLFVANVNGGLSEELPLPAGGFCSYSPDKKKLAYNRIFREFRTWKYYKGGMADDIWIYDFDTKKVENITNNPAQDIQPMWFEGKIYFLSDRDRTMNLFCYDLASKQVKKVTNYTDFDIKFPSLGNQAIVFEKGGQLFVMDLPSEKVSPIPVQIKSDEIYSRSELVDASKNIESASLGSDGNRMVFVARGEVFTVPAEKGLTRNLSRSSGSHERNAIWSPNGKHVAYISDQSGEDEIYIQVPDGQSQPVRLTNNGDVYKYAISWSPDSKKIMWADKKMRLQYVEVATKKITEIDHSGVWEFNDYDWSPDSRWVVYSRPERDSKGIIYIYNLGDGKKIPVTDGWYDSGNGTFSADGKYLYLVSNRDFNPTFSNTDFEIAYLNMSKVYLIPLSKETANPFAPVNDEVAVGKDTADTKDSSKTANKGKGEKSDSLKLVKVDADNIISRLLALNVDAASYYGVTALEGKVYYMKSVQGQGKANLCLFDLKDKKETVLGEANGFEISANRKKILIKKANSYYVMDVPSAKFELKDAVNLSEMKTTVNKREEWSQIFNESWRQMRDFFYDPNMHGVNWKAMHDKYAALLPYVNHRADLGYLIGEMLGELNVGHAYVNGGDMPKAERIKVGLLGASLSRSSNGYFRIDKILEGANYDASTRSPLTEVGVNIKTGDYIISINGISVTTTNDIYSLLINTADKQVEMMVNSKASPDGARKVIVIPTGDEKNLYYYNWVQHNIRFVDSVSGGKIGYLHIPNMGVDGLNEFMKHFYPQIRREALIIDDRGNGGGFVSPLIADRLAKQLVYFNMTRNTTEGSPNPEMHLGPKVCLVNEYSASDGDIFPYRFKTYKLGKVIGKRTWGGIVGIRGSLPFVDGASMTKPEFTSYKENEFVIEGYGVDPDIIVDNDPAHEYAGTDDQLNRAIDELLKELKSNPPKIPAIPPFPNKSH
ncbi:MAG: PDZ domain-containing protein [Bacteroidetes bacterium]|nr:PDZ domain-containing protein [Bacteroidota bacterium]